MAGTDIYFLNGIASKRKTVTVGDIPNCYTYTSSKCKCHRKCQNLVYSSENFKNIESNVLSIMGQYYRVIKWNAFGAYIIVFNKAYPANRFADACSFYCDSSNTTLNPKQLIKDIESFSVEIPSYFKEPERLYTMPDGSLIKNKNIPITDSFVRIESSKYTIDKKTTLDGEGISSNTLLNDNSPPPETEEFELSKNQKIGLGIGITFITAVIATVTLKN